jgi:hypothetical protein
VLQQEDLARPIERRQRQRHAAPAGIHAGHSDVSIGDIEHGVCRCQQSMSNISAIDVQLCDRGSCEFW